MATTAGGGVGHHHRHEVGGHRPLAAVEEGLAFVLQRDQPADAGADDDAEALGRDPFAAARTSPGSSPASRGGLLGGGDGELGEAVGAPRLTGASM